MGRVLGRVKAIFLASIVITWSIIMARSVVIAWNFHCLGREHCEMSLHGTLSYIIIV